MSSTVQIECPSCDEPLKVPPAVFGKKVKCKHCNHTFVVRDPDESKKPSKPAKPGAKPAAASPPPPPAPVPAKNPFLDDDDEGAAIKIEVITEDDTARCPHCAQVLEPPDAVVCVHCGFNNRTRAQANTKKVWAPSSEDWIMHLLPGVIALIVCITMIVLSFVGYFNMREWLAGSFLEMDEIDAAGRKRYYVNPGFFICVIVVISIIICVPSGKFAYRRLAKDYMPPEKVKL